MSKANIANELHDYIINSGQDAGEWSIDAMAEELDANGVVSIDDMDADDFIDFIQGWDGKVVDFYGNAVDFEAAMQTADSELCEELNDEGVESNQEYFERYADMHADKYDGEEFAPYYHHAW